MNEYEILVTPDLYFAAFLHAKNCEIIETKKLEGKVSFHFKVPKDSNLKGAFFNHKDTEFGMVNAYQYSNSIKNLKTLCHVRTKNI